MTAHDHTTSAPVEYRDVLGFPGYRVSNYGDVQSRFRRGRGASSWVADGPWRSLPVTLNGHKYLCVNLSRDGSCFNKKIHRLVLEAFVGPGPVGMQCRHLNGIKFDNRLMNLAWGTPEENAEDRRRHGRLGHIRSGPRPKLSKEQTIEVRRLRESGLLYREIGVIFGVARYTVSKIVRNKRRYADI